MKTVKLLVSAILVVAVVIIAARILFPLPSQEGRKEGVPASPSPDSVLAERLLPDIKAHPGKSGTYPLFDPAGSFAARMLLARAAKESIDVQYYIWHKDLTGLLLLDELRAAANRGVHVRLLVDDNGISELDDILSALDQHPNFEVRLYNPFTTRTLKQVGYAFDFFRLNRRMHNKSFAVDGLASIGGGRNIGDEYFGTGPHPAFVDLDILAVGATIQDISNDFAEYWNSASAFPFAAIVEPVADKVDHLDVALTEISKGPHRSEYEQEIANNETVSKLVQGELALEWSDAALISDPPSKTLGQAGDQQLLISQIGNLLGSIDDNFDIVSPYFIPGRPGSDHLVGLAKKGVKIRILTNAMEATDVLAVHAGYVKYRRELLEAGIELYELKATAAKAMKREDMGLAGSSSSSLHAKTFAADGERIYIGSFNFDPRSARLNTEMGLLVDSPDLARTLGEQFAGPIKEVAYRVTLDEDGQLQWHEMQDGQDIVHLQEPNTNAFSRGAIRVIGWLPIEWML